VKKLLNFFIIGTQKGGTTALDSFLRQHPGLQLSRVKEVHHFDDEARVDWLSPNHDQLHAQFEWSAESVLRGEATPIYIYWPQSLPRLQRYNPEAKLIVGLRHPVFRAFSHWRMEKKRGKEKLSFGDAISPAGRQRVSSAPGGVHRVYSYVERGFYAEQIERLLGLFPREQVYFFRADQLWNDPASTLAAIEKFLGVEERLGETARTEYTVPVDSSDLGDVPDKARASLQSEFAEDIVKSAQLSGVDLSDWSRPDYREPMRKTPSPIPASAASRP